MNFKINVTTILLCLIMFTSIYGCGVKGDPGIPPGTNLPSWQKRYMAAPSLEDEQFRKIRNER